MENLSLTRDTRYSVNEATANKTFIMLQRKRGRERGREIQRLVVSMERALEDRGTTLLNSAQCRRNPLSHLHIPIHMGIQWKAGCAGLHQLIHEEDIGLKVKWGLATFYQDR